jgi:hypothetical protein
MRRSYSYAALGMRFDTFIGGSVGLILGAGLERTGSHEPARY